MEYTIHLKHKGKIMKIIVKRRIFWYITLQAKNGETLLTSETYFSKNNAVRAAGKLARELDLPVAIIQ